MSMFPRYSTARGTAWGILNPWGALWTHMTFPTEEAARQHVRDFWRGTPQDVTAFTVEPVRVRVTKLPRVTNQAAPAADAATVPPQPREEP